MTDARTIPHNRDAEESLIGSMLISKGAIRIAVEGGATSASFHDPELGQLFDLIAAVYAEGVGIDPVTIAARSNGRGFTAEQLREIQAGTPASANAVDYLGTVLELARRREQIGLASELTDRLHSGADVTELVAHLATSVATAHASRGLIDGGRFVLDMPAHPPSVWGPQESSLWQRGESLLIVGPTGTGKTTLETQLVAASLGITDQVLGYAVEPAERVLVIAADRPQQIRRAFARLFGEEHRDVLEERLVIWPGPPPRDIGKHPDALLSMARDAGAERVFVDSLKDVALALSDDETGGAVNRAIQTCLAEGVDVAAMHHQRKGRDGQRPRTLEDVYGSTWLTAGAGSVVLLWGNAGDPIVDLVHLKQPAEPVGPWKIDHDHDTGISTVVRGQVDAFTMLQHAPQGLTARDVARVRTEKADPTDNDIRVARRVLDKLAARGQTHRVDATHSGPDGAQPARYYAITAELEGADQ